MTSEVIVGWLTLCFLVYRECSEIHTVVVVCTHFSGKEPYRHVGMGRLVTSGSLCDVMVSTLTRNTRDVGLVPALRTMFSHFHHTDDIGHRDHDCVQAKYGYVDEPTMCM